MAAASAAVTTTKKVRKRKPRDESQRRSLSRSKTEVGGRKVRGASAQSTKANSKRRTSGGDERKVRILQPAAQQSAQRSALSAQRATLNHKTKAEVESMESGQGGAGAGLKSVFPFFSSTKYMTKYQLCAAAICPTPTPHNPQPTEPHSSPAGSRVGSDK